MVCASVLINYIDSLNIKIANENFFNLLLHVKINRKQNRSQELYVNVFNYNFRFGLADKAFQHET